jgi:hypothetical protein
MEKTHFEIFKSMYVKNIEHLNDFSGEMAVLKLLDECADNFDDVLKNSDKEFVFKCFRQVDMSNSGNVDMAIWYLINGNNTPAFSKTVEDFFSVKSLT